MWDLGAKKMLTRESDTQDYDINYDSPETFQCDEFTPLPNTSCPSTEAENCLVALYHTYQHQDLNLPRISKTSSEVDIVCKDILAKKKGVPWLDPAAPGHLQGTQRNFPAGVEQRQLPGTRTQWLYEIQPMT